MSTCRAQIDWRRLPVFGYPIRCDQAFGHDGLHRNGWDHSWSEEYASYPPIPVGRANQCSAWSGMYQCRFDAGHDPDAEFGALIHAAGGYRWSDPHDEDEWLANEVVEVLAGIGEELDG